MNASKTITVQCVIKAPVNKVWDYWTQSEHLVNWNFASDDWHCPSAENDLREGGRFRATMAARDGSASFDFEGVNTHVKLHELIHYTIADGREVVVEFQPENDRTTVVETFEMENMHSEELQRNGWQAILDNFKKYVES